MDRPNEHKTGEPGALRPRRDGLPGSSSLSPPALSGVLPKLLLVRFYGGDKYKPIPRYPYRAGQRVIQAPRRGGLRKPHIWFDPRSGKWVCINYYAFHTATSPVFAWRGFVRAAIYQLQWRKVQP